MKEKLSYNPWNYWQQEFDRDEHSRDCAEKDPEYELLDRAKEHSARSELSYGLIATAPERPDRSYRVLDGMLQVYFKGLQNPSEDYEDVIEEDELLDEPSTLNYDDSYEICGDLGIPE